MGLFDHLFKSKSPPSEEDSVETGSKPAEPAKHSEPAVRGATPSRADPAGFLHPKSFVPRGIAPITPPSKSGAISNVRKPGALPGPAPAPVDEIVLTLGDVLSRIPSPYLKLGQHDPKRELRFSINDLSSDIARGRAAVPLSRIAQLVPDIFVKEISADEDTEVRLPLQKLVEQIGLLRSRPAGAAAGGEKTTRQLTASSTAGTNAPPSFKLEFPAPLMENTAPSPEMLHGTFGTTVDPVFELKPAEGSIFNQPGKEPTFELKPSAELAGSSFTLAPEKPPTAPPVTLPAEKAGVPETQKAEPSAVPAQDKGASAAPVEVPKGGLGDFESILSRFDDIVPIRLAVAESAETTAVLPAVPADEPPVIREPLVAEKSPSLVEKVAVVEEKVRPVSEAYVPRVEAVLPAPNPAASLFTEPVQPPTESVLDVPLAPLPSVEPVAPVAAEVPRPVKEVVFHALPVVAPTAGKQEGPLPAFVAPVAPTASANSGLPLFGPATPVEVRVPQIFPLTEGVEKDAVQTLPTEKSSVPIASDLPAANPVTAIPLPAFLTGEEMAPVDMKSTSALGAEVVPVLSIPQPPASESVSSLAQSSVAMPPLALDPIIPVTSALAPKDVPALPEFPQALPADVSASASSLPMEWLIAMASPALAAQETIKPAALHSAERAGVTVLPSVLPSLTPEPMAGALPALPTVSLVEGRSLEPVPERIGFEKLPGEPLSKSAAEEVQKQAPESTVPSIAAAELVGPLASPVAVPETNGRNLPEPIGLIHPSVDGASAEKEVPAPIASDPTVVPALSQETAPKTIVAPTASVEPEAPIREKVDTAGEPVGLEVAASSSASTAAPEGPLASPASAPEMAGQDLPKTPDLVHESADGISAEKAVAAPTIGESPAVSAPIPEQPLEATPPAVSSIAAVSPLREHVDGAGKPDGPEAGATSKTPAPLSERKIEIPVAPQIPNVDVREAPAASEAGNERIQLSLAAILKQCPREIIVGELPPIPDSVRITLPFAPIDRQLVMGHVEISAVRFIAAIPFTYQKYFTARIGVKVPIPLEEVFQNLPNPSKEEPTVSGPPPQILAPAVPEDLVLDEEVPPPPPVILAATVSSASAEGTSLAPLAPEETAPVGAAPDSTVPSGVTPDLVAPFLTEPAVTAPASTLPATVESIPVITLSAESTFVATPAESIPVSEVPPLESAPEPVLSGEETDLVQGKAAEPVADFVAASLETVLPVIPPAEPEPASSSAPVEAPLDLPVSHHQILPPPPIVIPEPESTDTAIPLAGTPVPGLVATGLTELVLTGVAGEREEEDAAKPHPIEPFPAGLVHAVELHAPPTPQEVETHLPQPEPVAETGLAPAGQGIEAPAVPPAHAVEIHAPQPEHEVDVHVPQPGMEAGMASEIRSELPPAASIGDTLEPVTNMDEQVITPTESEKQADSTAAVEADATAEASSSSSPASFEAPTLSVAGEGTQTFRLPQMIRPMIVLPPPIFGFAPTPTGTGDDMPVEEKPEILPENLQEIVVSPDIVVPVSQEVVSEAASIPSVMPETPETPEIPEIPAAAAKTEPQPAPRAESIHIDFAQAMAPSVGAPQFGDTNTVPAAPVEDPVLAMLPVEAPALLAEGKVSEPEESAPVIEILPPDTDHVPSVPAEEKPAARATFAAEGVFVESLRAPLTPPVIEPESEASPAPVDLPPAPSELPPEPEAALPSSQVAPDRETPAAAAEEVSVPVPENAPGPVADATPPPVDPEPAVPAVLAEVPVVAESEAALVAEPVPAPEHAPLAEVVGEAVPASSEAPAPEPVESETALEIPEIVPSPTAIEPDESEMLGAGVAASESTPVEESDAPLLHLPRIIEQFSETEVLPPPALPLRRFDQDALQALFMTEDVLDLPKISRLAAQLPGVHACVIATRDQACTGGTLPEGFDLAALLGLAPRVGEAAGRMPIGALKHFTLYGERYSVSFFARNGLSLCAVHRPRSFVPGVREKLVAIADELSK